MNTYSRLIATTIVAMFLAATAAAGQFSPAVNYPTGPNPTFVAVADLDGDGVLDLVLADSNQFGIGISGISVLLGRGDGTFQATTSFPAGRTPRSLAIADLNRDGIPDVIVTNESNGSVSVLLGQGDGTFGAPIPSPAGPKPFYVAIGDFNADGIPDAAITNFVTTGRISILLGKGDGTFQSPVAYKVTPSVRTHMIAIADLNGDGQPDLIVASAGVGIKLGGVSTLLGNGDGTFQAAKNIMAGANPFAVTLGDFNNDGLADLAVADETASEVSILLGKSGGKFSAPVTYATGTLPFNLVAADVNNDGNLDLVTANEGSNDATVLLGDGKGGFAAPGSYAADAAPQWLAVGDFNGDGFPDVAVANEISNDVSVLLNSGSR